MGQMHIQSLNRYTIKSLNRKEVATFDLTIADPQRITKIFRWCFASKTADTRGGMDEQNEASQRPRYKWPWFVLGAVILGLALAIFWMSVLVRRIREQRENNSWPQPTQPAPQTNPPAARTNAPP